MAKIVAFATKIRNNWKKSVFGVAALTYGGNYAHEKYQINELMRKYCDEAAAHGNVTEPSATPLKKVLVILNPIANRRGAQKSFDEYCAPILHLAGLAVEVLKTDSEGHARRHLEDPDTELPTAILVAGGDGTLSEALTGLLRRGATATPLGVLPCGRTNSLARELFGYSNESTLTEVEGMARAAIAIVRGRHTATDVIKVEPIVEDAGEATEQQTEQAHRPIFALGSVQWGAFRDATQLRDNYWYTGPLREYCAYLFNAFGQRLTWQCPAELTYSPPCSGCSNCFVLEPAAATAPVGAAAVQQPRQQKRWWSGYSAPKGQPTFAGVQAATVEAVDYSRLLNPQCGVADRTRVQPHELVLRNNAARGVDELPRLSVQLNGGDGGGLSGVAFVQEGWSRVRGSRETAMEKREFEVRAMEIRPAAEAVHAEGRERFFSIDNEAYEVKAVRVSVVPRAVRVFTTTTTDQ